MRNRMRCRGIQDNRYQCSFLKASCRFANVWDIIIGIVFETLWKANWRLLIYVTLEYSEQVTNDRSIGCQMTYYRCKAFKTWRLEESLFKEDLLDRTWLQLETLFCLIVFVKPAVEIVFQLQNLPVIWYYVSVFIN